MRGRKCACPWLRHVETDVGILETKVKTERNNHPVVSTVEPTPRSYGIHSGVHVKHDHHPQSATGGVQPHAKRVDARTGIMEVAIGKAF